MAATKRLVLVTAAALGAGPAAWADAGVSAETGYLLSTLLFLMGGFLVMWMAAGFTMLEAGLVRVKNVADICLKNISLYSLSCIMFLIIGYNLMYSGVGEGFGAGLVGLPGLWGGDDSAVLNDTPDFSAAPYAAGSDFFFQMVFVATTASIVSGTVAERVRLFPFLVFVAVLAGLIYPVEGAWHWGGGWLAGMGFADFAGSTVVHAAGGWAALTGALILGPRRGRYTPAGQIRPMPGSNLPMATLGTFILWVGWFGFNGASQLAFASAGDAVAVSNIFVNTNMAASGGVIAAMAATKLIYRKTDLSMVCNGALAGLVSITAGPDTPAPIIAMLIGAVGGVIVVLTVPLLDRLKIDDVVGAIPVHLLCGIWGTLAVPLTNDDASFTIQLAGVAAVGAFVGGTSAVTWLILKATVGIRLHQEDEASGADLAELGLEAYPEFGSGSQKLRY